eukprot:COSAG02_NODE_12971_length_1466_cov_1.438917_1_plen_34_part_01
MEVKKELVFHGNAFIMGVETVEGENLVISAEEKE